MQSIQRSLMMLKPDGSQYADSKYQAALKLQTDRDGLMLELSALVLPPGEYALYLFEADGCEHLAGPVHDGPTTLSIAGVPLSDVAAAAVIHQSSLDFVLKSPGVNWREVAARFKFAHAPKAAKEPAEGSVVNEAVIEAVSTHAAQQPPQTQDAQVSEQQTQAPAADTEELCEMEEAPSAVCDSCPHVIRQDRINPFPSAFPNSEWVKISYPGPTGWWHYISGTIRNENTVVAKVLGVPGEYGMAPPIWLEGFGTYMRCVTPDARGYWLMFQDAETGEVLDMGLSPHGG